jgi:hypothetical protein
MTFEKPHTERERVNDEPERHVICIDEYDARPLARNSWIQLNRRIDGTL